MRNYGMGFVLSVLALLVSLFGLTRSDATAHSTTMQMLSRKALHTIAGAGMVYTKQVCNGPPKNCAPTLYNQSGYRHMAPAFPMRAGRCTKCLLR